MRRLSTTEAIVMLARMRQELLDRIRSCVAEWPQYAVAVWVFGSMARGGGDVASDLDVFVIRPDAVHDDEPDWRGQLAQLEDQVRRWTGNECRIVEMSESEVTDMVRAGERLAEELRKDSLNLYGDPAHRLLRKVSA